MKQSLRRFTFAALMLILTSGGAWAQLSTAQMSGQVTDESGAVLPGVTVTATQTDTGATRTVVTGENGSYALPNLPTGPYRLEAMLQGFRAYVQTGIVLQVAAAPVINVALALGNVEETVTVAADAPLVDVKSAGIGTVIENERILELPLQGRQVTDLILLAGAAVQTGQPNTRSFQGGVNIAVAGGQGFGVAYLLDGAMHNDPSTAAGLPLPFPDALQEFRLATSGLSAENGIHSGASVNAVTKSGTNRFHGNGFEFYRDQAIQRDQPVCAGRAGRQAAGRWPASESVRRNAWRADCPEQALFLRRLSAYAAPSAAERQHRVCTDARDAGRRLYRLRLAGVQQRKTDHAGGAVRSQPRQSRTLQSSRDDARAIAPGHDRSVRRSQISVWRRREHPGADGGPGRFSTNRR